MNGHHRNIFVEHGIISTVTTYHKGYAISRNTKIIHCYLHKEVRELLVYYLWMIQPLRRKLELLVLRRWNLPSPFFWAATGSLEPWNSSRLSRVMQRETKEALGVAINIQAYRHLAVAMSRKHLPYRGFKRDYGIDDSKADAQGSHTTWTAGTVYARGLEEAAGHEEARKSEYCKEEHSVIRRGGGSRVRNGRLLKEGKPQALGVDGFWNTERLEKVMKRGLSKLLLNLCSEVSTPPLSPATMLPALPLVLRLSMLQAWPDASPCFKAYPL
jgi:hypothetical protein